MINGEVRIGIADSIVDSTGMPIEMEDVNKLLKIQKAAEEMPDPCDECKHGCMEDNDGCRRSVAYETLTAALADYRGTNEQSR